ncbi:MAG: spore coat protein [Firmicutes bacterium]|nr:spore coat protein [Bacillota bacterium]MBQ6535797.1 spore coat protein [Bacillota bacterium]
MNFTPKEESLLKELRSQERLCVEKYGRYADSAHDPALKDLFGGIRQTETRHLQTLDQLSSGSAPQMQGQQQGQQGQQQSPPLQQSSGQGPAKNSPEWQQDSFLCSDALTMEKHVSGLYDTSIFEFSDPAVRQALNHIQSEEQGHGESIYSYMHQNGMYN